MAMEEWAVIVLDTLWIFARGEGAGPAGGACSVHSAPMWMPWSQGSLAGLPSKGWPGGR